MIDLDDNRLEVACLFGAIQVKGTHGQSDES